MLTKDEENDKAIYRRGMAYMGMGDIDKAKADLTHAFDITGGKDINVINGIQQLKAKIAKDKE